MVMGCHISAIETASKLRNIGGGGGGGDKKKKPPKNNNFKPQYCGLNKISTCNYLSRTVTCARKIKR